MIVKPQASKKKVIHVQNVWMQAQALSQSGEIYYWSLLFFQGPENRNVFLMSPGVWVAFTQPYGK